MPTPSHLEKGLYQKTMKIRNFNDADFGAVLDITIKAFSPIHDSFQHILGDTVFKIIYPDWKEGYKDYLSSLNQEEKENFLVAENEGSVVGYIIYSMDTEKKIGELGLNCVAPDHQNQGIGYSLYGEAISRMDKMGMKLVEVLTGGDESHAPARRAYEKAGFVALPLTRYYKAL